MRWARTVLFLMAAPALAALACETVDLGNPPSDINACRPSQSYFVYGTSADGGGNNGIWRDLLDKDYGGKKCHDSACHGAGSTNSLRLEAPTCVPQMPMDPLCPVPIPLTGLWADNYRSAAEEMNCSNVAASKLLVYPTDIMDHGGGKIIEPDGPEATLIKMWISQP